MTYIGFTGHRNCHTDENKLAEIATAYPGAVWVHGGADGFDWQVSWFAAEHGIPQLVIRPDYHKYTGKRAPIERDKEIVQKCDLLVACYDGRKEGGTYFTIGCARKAKKEIKFVSAVKKDGEK